MATALATGGAGAVAAPEEIAAGTALGAGVGHVLGEITSFAMAGRTGGTSRTVGGARVGRQNVRVDVEYPTGGSSGNVHVQWKGPGGPGKQFLNGLEDLQQLPRAIRENVVIQRAVAKAFDLLSRFTP